MVHDVQRHNPKKIIDKYGKEALVRFADYNIEKIAQACRDKNVQQIFIIIDAKKFTFKQMTAPGGTITNKLHAFGKSMLSDNSGCKFHTCLNFFHSNGIGFGWSEASWASLSWWVETISCCKR